MARVAQLGQRLTWQCLVCGHPVSAMTDPALQAAMRDHAAYIAQTTDPVTDPHFEDLRREALS